MRLGIPRRKLTPERVVARLKKDLAREFRHQLREIRTVSPIGLTSRLNALRPFAQLQDEVCTQKDSSPAQLGVHLERWTQELWAARTSGQTDDALLGRTLMHLARARGKLGWLASERTLLLVLPTDLLFQLHQTLFPAERMAVIAGRYSGGQLVLGACFDVTSSESSRLTYSRADPGRLASALIAMDESGTRLAAWAHSHPGGASIATHPSDIDRRQWAAWSQDYEQLLGLILTADGHVRFWGDPVESGELRVRLCGQGCREVESNVYHITR